jgi:hypothetical protein
VTGAPGHVRRNRAAWDRWAADYAEAGLYHWSTEPSWGICPV